MWIQHDTSAMGILFCTCEQAIKSMNVYAAMPCRDWFRMPQLAVTSHSTDSTLSNAIEELKGLLLRRFFAGQDGYAIAPCLWKAQDKTQTLPHVLFELPASQILQSMLERGSLSYITLSVVFHRPEPICAAACSEERRSPLLSKCSQSTRPTLALLLRADVKFHSHPSHPACSGTGRR